MIKGWFKVLHQTKSPIVDASFIKKLGFVRREREGKHWTHVWENIEADVRISERDISGYTIDFIERIIIQYTDHLESKADEAADEAADDREFYENM